MNLLRCSGLLIVVSLGACDARETPVPKPKTESSVEAPAPVPASPAVRSTVDAPSESVVSPDPVKQSGPPSHDMAPSVPVVPVVAGTPPVSKDQAARSAQAQSAKTAEPKASQSKAGGKRDSVADNRKAKKAGKDTPAKDVRLHPPKLDLSLPPELVKELEPPAKVIPARRKPILPPMFDTNGTPSGAGPFELNGRLLSNEMQLQMRNDNRRDVEGAALDFKFKQ
jgi:hypothetical protein